MAARGKPRTCTHKCKPLMPDVQIHQGKPPWHHQLVRTQGIPHQADLSHLVLVEAKDKRHHLAVDPSLCHQRSTHIHPTRHQGDTHRAERFAKRNFEIRADWTSIHCPAASHPRSCARHNPPRKCSVEGPESAAIFLLPVAWQCARPACPGSSSKVSARTHSNRAWQYLI